MTNGITQSARDYIGLKIRRARQNGFSELVITARDVHNALSLESRYPCVCGAMRSIDGMKFKEMYSPPKGNGSRLKIKYYL